MMFTCVLEAAGANFVNRFVDLNQSVIGKKIDRNFRMANGGAG